MRKKALFLSILFSLQAVSAIPKKAQDDLVKYRTEVMEMGARLSTLEKEIGSKNNLYLSSVESIKRFEGDIALYKEKLQSVRVDVMKSRSENRKILQSYLVESQNDATEAWQRKVHLELLKTAQEKLKKKEQELISLENKVVEFDQKLAELKKDEVELQSVISELEGRKKVAMEKYLTKVEAKKKAESKVHQAKLATRLKKVRKQLSSTASVASKPERFFAPPLEDFSGYKSSPKGVTFHFKAIQPVKATGAGKIVFAGDLASYGQVVMIDHGNDLRSVILGKMTIKVKKNDTVKNGAIIAYTLNDTKEDQNLYFEVRKKNTAQNTILWLEKDGVSKI